jgi:hypothetical protein
MAIVVAAAALPYLPTIDDYFAQDDFGVVWLLSGKPWSAFPTWFYTTWMDDIWGYTPDEIRPFPALSYQLAALGGAASPAPNHLINIAFHAANGLLVLALARVAAGLSLPAAAAAAVVFAVLPVQAETVAWVTGRVDSMPAFFYLAAFVLYARWRAGGGSRVYVWSVVAFAAALLSKQNTITLAPALLLFDAIVLRRPLRPSWRWLAAYVPFGLLTAAYLLLRYIVFGEVAREGSLTAERVGLFPADVASHLHHITAGMQGPPGLPLAIALLAAVALVAIVATRVTIFAVLWIAIGIAPTLVAGYSSPRHVYLASAGWALLIGVAADALWRAQPARLFRGAAGIATAMLVAFYALQLTRVVDEWGTRAAVSQAAVRDLEREALMAPPGSLIVAGAPPRSWAFALPFAARPPFARTDITSRVAVISHSSLHCCAADQWDAYTREAMRDWLGREDRPPVIALYWNPQTGALSRLTDREEPFLRSLIELLLKTDSVASLDRVLADALESLVAPRTAAGG